MSRSIHSDFRSSNSSLRQWNFSGPSGNDLLNKGGYWNWSNKKTPSSNTGPSQPYGKGYVYIETSSPTQVGDIFTMTSIDTFDLSHAVLSISFKYNMYVDIPITLEMLVWNSFEWIKETSFTLEQNELTDVWRDASYELGNYNNADCVIRFRVVIPEGGKIYRKDLAIGDIVINISDEDTDSIVSFFDSRNIKKRKHLGILFDNSSSSKDEFDNSLLEFKQNINDMDFSKYPNGIVIRESEDIIHVFTSADKD